MCIRDRVNGMTQTIGTEGYGWIPRWYEGEKISYIDVYKRQIVLCPKAVSLWNTIWKIKSLSVIQITTTCVFASVTGNGHGVHLSGQKEYKLVYERKQLLCLCQAVGTVVSSCWHCYATPLAHACQYGGTSMAQYKRI